MKKYYIINSDGLVEPRKSNLKEVKKTVMEMNDAEKRRFGEGILKELYVYSFEYNSKKIDIDYGMDRELYVLDKNTDELIEFDDFRDNGIVCRILKKDFLYRNKK